MTKTEWSAPSTRIKTILKERGLTQQDLANRLTNPNGEVVTVQNVKQLLNKPSIRTDTLKRIADALDVPMWRLFASREEIVGDTNNISIAECPHCGKPITIKTTIE